MANTVRSDDRIRSVEQQRPVKVKAFDQQIDPGSVSESTRDTFTSLAEWFGEVARTLPQSLAVSSGSESLSYRELEERANRLAHRLRSQGVSRGTVVGLLLTR